MTPPGSQTLSNEYFDVWQNTFLIFTNPAVSQTVTAEPWCG
jgi:hypothetical protein